MKKNSVRKTWRLTLCCLFVMALSPCGGAMDRECGEVIIDPGLRDVKSELMGAVQRFLESVAKRDKEAFSSFFQTKEGFYALLPGGREFDSPETFLKSQEGLFGDSPPKITQELKRLYSGGENFGTAAVLVTVEPSDGGNVTRSYVTLVFKKSDDSWQILHIQNTPVANEEE